MEIGLDLSSKWNLPCSLQIAKSLEPYGIMYLEDPMLPDNIEAYATLARETSIPVCLSERLATRFRFREMFESRAVDVVMYDVTWCGGISEARDLRHGRHLQNPNFPAHRRWAHPLVCLHPHGHSPHELYIMESATTSTTTCIRTFSKCSRAG
jgi:L-alanine-DL-glutamate epimerase-like enolase superfamily enzyme